MAGDQNKSLTLAPTATGSTEPRDLRDRFADVVNIKDYGAKGDGTTDDTTAVVAMMNDVGYAFIPAGTYRVGGSVELDYPLYFAPGAAFTVNANDTIVIRNTIDSPRQWIFKGDGN